MDIIKKKFIKAITHLLLLLLWVCQLITLFLKLTKVVDWHWFWILFPIFLLLTVFFVGLIFALLSVFVLYLGKIKIKRKVLNFIKNNAKTLNKSEDFASSVKQMNHKEQEEIKNLLNKTLKKTKSEKE